MAAKICWSIASALLLISGVLHVHGIFFSEDLYPESKELILQLRSTGIKMVPTADFWGLWIGFNALFGMCLVFMGATVLYLTLAQFSFLRRQYCLLILVIATNAFFVWVGYRYMITGFTISMSVPLALFITGCIWKLGKQSRG